MTSSAFCVLVTFVFDAATAPAEALQPDPDRAVPPRIGKVLGLLRTLITYGRNLADTLRQHSAAPHLLPCFAFVVTTFATTDLALILARIARGLLRAAALEDRLRQRAARGQDLQQPARSRPPSARKPRAADPATRQHDPAGDPCLASPPTLEQIAAEDRRRPIGAVLVDICLDLGIAPGQMDRATWDELSRAVIEYGGSLVTLMFSRFSRKLSQLSAETSVPFPSPARPSFPPGPQRVPPPLAGGSSREADRCGRGPCQLRYHGPTQHHGTGPRQSRRPDSAPLQLVARAPLWDGGPSHELRHE